MKVSELILAAKNETNKSAFLTPYGMRECRKMSCETIAAVFGNFAASFWEKVRNREINIKCEVAK